MKDCQEWSLAFDQLYNNISSNKAPGLDEYEKSVFLTDAQEAIVIGVYNGSFGKPFESTEDVANFLAPLVRQADLELSDDAVLNEMRVDKINGKIYKLPSDKDEILFRTLELCMLKNDCDVNGNRAIVVPVTQDEYWRTFNDPFKTCNHHRVLRLIFSKSESNSGTLDTHKYTELISKIPIMSYTVRYISRPEPIILADDLEERGLTIHGKKDQQTCLLDEAIHQAILSEAVRLAKEAWNN